MGEAGKVPAQQSESHCMGVDPKHGSMQNILMNVKMDISLLCVVDTQNTNSVVIHERQVPQLHSKTLACSGSKFNDT